MKPDEVAHMVERLRRRSTFDYGITHIEILKGAAGLIERLARQVPPDCVVVPRTLTKQMRDAFKKAYQEGSIWSNRLDAAVGAMIAAGEVK